MPAIFKNLLLLTLTGAWFVTDLAAAPSPNAKATLVIYNSADPSSATLANYYAAKREIPLDHLIGIPCPTTEEISRLEYQTTIARPIRDKLISEGWWKMDGTRVTATTIRYAVLMRGMPLKIRQNGALENGPLGRNDASVDSELSCMGFAADLTVGPVRNPYFEKFTPVLDSVLEPGMLLVCRLDGISLETVQRMIDDSIATEKSGLYGWAYIDTRGLTEGPYKLGDDWIGAIATQLRPMGVPVLWDKAPPTLAEGYPVTDAALYYGWYDENASGPFADPMTRFRPGAVAVHLHSFSAPTLRDPKAGWCGPLLELGAAATLGNVYEPYLVFTSYLMIFQARLSAGYTFAESAYISVPGLSWMNVAIGDPLYRPYAAWKEAPVVDDDWTKYRNIILAAGGDFAVAAQPLAEAAQQTGDSMFLESLGAVQADAGDWAGALKTVDAALALKNSSLVAFRLALEKLSLLGALGQPEVARTLLYAEMVNPPGIPQGLLLQRIRNRYFPTPTPTPQ